MLKKALKNYFANLLYLCVAMGIIYLILIIATYWFLFSTVKDLGFMFDDIFDLIGSSVEVSGTAVEDFFDYALGRIDWNQDFLTVVKQIIDTNWLKTTVEGFLNTLNVSTENFTGDFNKILKTFTTEVVASLAVCVTLLFAGVYCANLAVGYLVRRKTAKRSIKQSIINFVVSPLFLTAIVFAVAWLSTLIKGYTFILLAALGLVYEFISFTQSWFVYGRKTIKFKEAVNVKNIGLNILSAVIIIAIAAALFALLSLINLFIAILIIIPVAIYSLNIISVNDDSYISELVSSKQAEQKS